MKHLIIFLVLILVPIDLLSNDDKSNEDKTLYYLQLENQSSEQTIMENHENFHDNSMDLIRAITPNSILWVKNPSFDHPQFTANTTTRFVKNSFKYYRIQNPSIMLLINLELAAHQSTTHLLTWISANSFFFGVILILLFYNFYFKSIVTSIDLSVYLYFHLFIILVLLDRDGWLQKIFWFNHPLISYIFTSITIVLASSFMAQFTRVLFATKSKAKALDTSLMILIVLNILSLLLLFVTPLVVSLELISLFALFTTIVILITTIYGFFTGLNKKQRYFHLAWMALSLALIVEYLRSIGYLPYNLLSLSILKATLFIELISISTKTLSTSIDTLQEEKKGLEKSTQESEYKLSQRQFDAKQLQRKQELLNKLAGTDSLTGLYNRREFFNQAESAIFRAKTSFEPYSVMMLDLDHFKNINDTYGHDVGDIVLKSVTQSINEKRRDDDIFGRLGGEEFAIFMPNTTKHDAEIVAERCCTLVRELQIDSGKEIIHITVSIGVASDAGRDYTLSELIKSSDTALYEAKNNGRDRFISVEGIYTGK